MADHSAIEWTDATWNPIVGCSVVSPGCTNCYAMKMARRIEAMQPAAHYAGTTKAVNGNAVWTGEVALAPEHILTQPLRWRKPRAIFVNSMGDLFHEAVPDAWIDRVFAVMALTPQHTYQVLTKRPARMRAYFATWPMNGKPDRISDLAYWTACGRRGYNGSAGMIARPLPNALLGVSIEDQHRAAFRREDLSALAAAGWRTFVSYEPALEPVDWTGWEFLTWLISGGESGPGARPSHPDCHRGARDFCAAHRIPYFFKQWGEWHTAYIRTSTGERVFRQFDTFQRWVNKASTWVNGGICLDRWGQHLRIGSDFMSARDEGLFPVTIMHRVGKRAAGRMLDGVEHNGMPATLAEAA